jgi:pimeloyl-ACP methyl ester carboxylesterase
VQRSVVLQGVGHFVAEERPAEVTRELQTFFTAR